MLLSAEVHTAPRHEVREALNECALLLAHGLSVRPDVVASTKGGEEEEVELHPLAALAGEADRVRRTREAGSAAASELEVLDRSRAVYGALEAAKNRRLVDRISRLEAALGSAVAWLDSDDIIVVNSAHSDGEDGAVEAGGGDVALTPFELCARLKTVLFAPPSVGGGVAVDGDDEGGDDGNGGGDDGDGEREGGGVSFDLPYVSFMGPGAFEPVGDGTKAQMATLVTERAALMYRLTALERNAWLLRRSQGNGSGEASFRDELLRVCTELEARERGLALQVQELDTKIEIARGMFAPDRLLAQRSLLLRSLDTASVYRTALELVAEQPGLEDPNAHVSLDGGERHKGEEEDGDDDSAAVAHANSLRLMDVVAQLQLELRDQYGVITSLRQENASLARQLSSALSSAFSSGLDSAPSSTPLRAFSSSSGSRREDGYGEDGDDGRVDMDAVFAAERQKSGGGEEAMAAKAREALEDARQEVEALKGEVAELEEVNGYLSARLAEYDDIQEALNSSRLSASLFDAQDAIIEEQKELIAAVEEELVRLRERYERDVARVAASRSGPSPPPSVAPSPMVSSVEELAAIRVDTTAFKTRLDALMDQAAAARELLASTRSPPPVSSSRRAHSHIDYSL